jgi:hypothetical protein
VLYLSFQIPPSCVKLPITLGILNLEVSLDVGPWDLVLPSTSSIANDNFSNGRFSFPLLLRHPPSSSVQFAVPFVSAFVGAGNALNMLSPLGAFVGTLRRNGCRFLNPSKTFC